VNDRRVARWRVLAITIGLGVAAACSDGQSAPPTIPPATAPSTTAPASTVPPTSKATTSTTTTTTTTTLAPRPVEELAGARVLCRYQGPTVPDELLARLRHGKAAGVLWFGDNLPDIETAQRNAAAIRAAASAAPDPAPAIVATDQEGGGVRRIPGPPRASAAQLATQGATTIRAEAGAAATTLREWGVNVDLAPVADVGRPGSFMAAQLRTFGGDPRVVAEDVVAFVNGLHDQGVRATLKHFPGLGAATTNTDLAPSVVEQPANELRSVDLRPFAEGVAAGADLVMMSSARYPALDAAPAVVSRTIVDGVLRNEIGFDGVIISDAFDTPAVAELGPIGEVAVRAAQAGVDLFISSSPATCGALYEAFANAIGRGEIARADANATYDRVMRLRRGLRTG
jgi:beta-N-acetylhexosaminidase